MISIEEEFHRIFGHCHHRYVYVPAGHVGGHRLPDYLGYWQCQKCGKEVTDREEEE